jgi:hypothetical protein
MKDFIIKHERAISLFLMLITLIGLILISGCVPPIKDLHDERFKTGCAVVKGNFSLGVLNTQGSAEACKLVCSPKLPKGFSYKYDSGMCKVSIGSKNE